MARNTAGISYFDLLEWVRSLERTWNCHIHYELHPPARPGAGIAWTVRVSARWFKEGGVCIKERGEWASWPNSEAATMVGLELLLLNRLDRKLEDEAQREVRAQHGQTRLPTL